MIKKVTKFIFLGLFLYAFAGNNEVLGQEKIDITGTFIDPEWSDGPLLTNYTGNFYKVTIKIESDNLQEFKFRKDTSWDNDKTWGAGNINIGSKHSYDHPGDNTKFTPSDVNHYFTFSMKYNGEGEQAEGMVQETSAEPVTIEEVTQFPLAANVGSGQDVTVTASLSAAPSQEEIFYVRYSTDPQWSTSSVEKMTVNGDEATADIPAQGYSTVSYYVFSTTIEDIQGDYDLATIHLKNAGDGNFEYTAGNWFTAQDGDWDNPSTWTLDAVPPTDKDIDFAGIEHNVTVNQDVIARKIEFIEDNVEITFASGVNLTLVNEGEIIANTNGANFDAEDGNVTFEGLGYIDGNVTFGDVTIKGGVYFGTNSIVKKSLTLDEGYLSKGYFGDHGGTDGVSNDTYIPTYIGETTLIIASNFDAKGTKHLSAGIGTSNNKKPANLTIKADKELEFFGSLRYIEGTLTLEEDAKFITGGSLVLLSGSHLELGTGAQITGSVTFQKEIDGVQGWRMLSTPTNRYGVTDLTFEDYLSGLWTQGFTGAEYEEGESNVHIFDKNLEGGAGDFVSIGDKDDLLPKGEGFITYVFEVDNYEQKTGDFPKTLNIFGDLNSGDVTVPLNETKDNFNLLGNPYASTLDWDALKADNNDVKDAVYAYKSGVGYVEYSNGIGDLTDGEIPSFQGFWVESAADKGGAEFTFKESAIKKGNATLYKNKNQSASFKLLAEINGMKNHTYFSFSDNGTVGRDNSDALNLEPLDFMNHLSMGTLVNGVNMSINNLPLQLEEEVEFPLSINALEVGEEGYVLQSGTVSLKADDFKNMPEAWDVFVNNYNTGERVNLREVAEYSFMLNPKQKVMATSAPRSILTPPSPTPNKAKAVEQSRITISIVGFDTPTSTEVKDTPVEFGLEQNYPNPFNPTTTIKYSVPQAGNVTLAVYNIMGQKVAELVNTGKAAGSYSVQWDAANAASGMYFYKLSSAGQSITKQMMLIK